MPTKRFNADNNGIPMLPGHGLDSEEYDNLSNQALDEWPRGKQVFYLVVEERVENDGGFDTPKISEGKAYKSRAKAIEMAKARASGNVDQRVLKVSSEAFVLSTDAVERMEKRKKRS